MNYSGASCNDPFNDAGSRRLADSNCCFSRLPAPSTLAPHDFTPNTRPTRGFNPSIKEEPRMETPRFIARQGDVLIMSVTKIPAGTKKTKRENGLVVLAHGEVTGHHHSIADEAVELVTSEQADELRMWLTVTAPEPVALTHQEHDTILIPPGLYEVRRQREYSPEAIRNVAD